jgi:hypothetical protein
MRKRKEERLVRKAARALAKLAAYRQRHASTEAEVAAAHMTRTARIAGW